MVTAVLDHFPIVLIFDAPLEVMPDWRKYSNYRSAENVSV